MDATEAIRRIMERGDSYAGDCADLCREYVAMLGADPGEKASRPLNVWKVMAVLGRPKLTNGDYGDVVYGDGHLGIHLGYAMLTVHEDDGRWGRVPLPQRRLAWAPR